MAQDSRGDSFVNIHDCAFSLGNPGFGCYF